MHTNQEEMTMGTRTFTPDELEAIGVPFECYNPGDANPGGYAVELHREQTDTRRWVSVHELVFRAPDDDKAYRVHYERGLTEHQECDIWSGSDEIEATEVALRPVTVERWFPVEAPRPVVGATA